MFSGPSGLLPAFGAAIRHRRPQLAVAKKRERSMSCALSVSIFLERQGLSATPRNRMLNLTSGRSTAWGIQFYRFKPTVTATTRSPVKPLLCNSQHLITKVPEVGGRLGVAE